jgi:hypothetical protein
VLPLSRSLHCLPRCNLRHSHRPVPSLGRLLRISIRRQSIRNRNACAVLEVSAIVLRMRFSVSTSILRMMISTCQTNALATGVDLPACHLVENRDLAVFQHGSCQIDQLPFAVQELIALHLRIEPAVVVDRSIHVD